MAFFIIKVLLEAQVGQAKAKPHTCTKNCIPGRKRGLLLILILHTKFKGWQQLVWLPSKINSGYKRINHGIYFHISMFQFGNKI